MDKTIKRNVEEAAIAKKAAQITGKNRRTIKRVMNGDYENEEIMNVVMFLSENERKVWNAAKKRFNAGAFSVN